MNAPHLYLNNPTPLMLAVASCKGFNFEVADTKEVLPGIIGPSLSFGPEVVAGEAGALGWMDRRHPYPPLFPHDTNQYSRVATLSYALDNDQVCPQYIFSNRDPSRPFLFARHPTLADVLLAMKLEALDHVPNDALDFVRSVFSYCGPQDLVEA